MSSVPKSKSKGPINFVLLPSKFLVRPPDISVFEMNTLGAVVAIARTMFYSAERKKYQYAQGGKSIARYKDKVRRRGADIGKAQSLGEFNKRVRQGFECAGYEGYDNARKSFVLKDHLTIIVTQAELLRLMGRDGKQAYKSENLEKLKQALEQLCYRVVPGLPPLLKDAKRTPSGKVRLIVNKKWLPKGRFNKVPLPVPSKGGGKVTMALYLFLLGCQYKTKRDITLVSLYLRLGIKATRPSYCKRLIEDALAQINKHLAGCSSAAGAADEIPEYRTPYRFKAKFLPGDRIRFSAKILVTKEEREMEKMRAEIEKQEAAAEREKAEAERMSKAVDEALLAELGAVEENPEEEAEANERWRRYKQQRRLDEWGDPEFARQIRSNLGVTR
jgi:hypothetical protein